jgi:hypothetical protein
MIGRKGGDVLRIVLQGLEIKMKNFESLLSPAYNTLRLLGLDRQTVCFDWSASSCLLGGAMFALNLNRVRLVIPFHAS